MTEPFSDIRVIDLSNRFSGAFAARLFGDFGAEVVLLESPEGHALRKEPPFGSDDQSSNSSVIHSFANWNKQSVVYESESVRDEWIKSADIVITTSVDRDYIQAVQAAASPDTIHLSITPHGLHGPLEQVPGNNLSMSARVGWASVNGYRDEPPLAMPRNQHGIVGGVAGYIVAAASIRCRESVSKLGPIDVSELEAFALTVHPWGVAAVYNGLHKTAGPGGGRLRGAPGPLWPLSDGRMNLGLADFHNWKEAMDVCNLPEQGRRTELIPDFGRHSKDLRDVVHGLAESLPKLKRWDVFHALAELRCVIGVVQDMDDLTKNEHLVAREYFTETQVNSKRVRVSGAPAKLHPAPWRVKQSAPELGQHEIGLDRAETRSKSTGASTQNQSLSSDGPLTGVRVLSFAQAWSGTFGTELLALLGADVVQISSTKHPDSFRRISNRVPPGVADDSKVQHPPNTQGHYNSVNLHKREINLDLTSNKGQQILWELIPQFDMLVDNFRPTVLPKWGITLDKLNELRPGIILASISGYGETGPYSHYPANGATTEPMSGFSSLHGYLNDEGMNSGGLYPDPICGYFLVATILAALRHRDLTGEPQRVDLSMLEAVASILGDALMQYDVSGTLPKPQGNSHPLYAPHNMYRTKDEEWIAIAVESETDWLALKSLIDEEQLSEDSFSTMALRKANEAKLDEFISKWVVQAEAAPLAEQLNAHGVCAARVTPLIEMYSKPEPNLRQAGFIQRIDHPEAGITWLPGRPWRFSGLTSTPIRPAPCVGEHTQEVLEQLLGLSESQYLELVRQGITGTLEEEQTFRQAAT